MSYSVTDLRLPAIASSKWALVIMGTGSISEFLVSYLENSSSAMIDSLIATFTALWQSSVRSAPEKPSHSLARNYKFTFEATGLFLRIALIIPFLASWSGKGI